MNDTMNIIEIISQYLHDNRRLVVPSFGAFIVKDTGEVLFSELLKSDDGVLRSLLSDKGLGEVAAAGAIDRFIFEARDAISETGRFPMGALGVLTVGANGALRLEQVATRRPAAEPRPVAKPKPQQPPRSAEVVCPQRKRRGTDWFMIIAIIVLLGALAAIAYGYFCSTQQGDADDAMMDELRYRIEQPATPDNHTQNTI